VSADDISRRSESHCAVVDESAEGTPADGQPAAATDDWRPGAGRHKYCDRNWLTITLAYRNRFGALCILKLSCRPTAYSEFCLCVIPR